MPIRRYWSGIGPSVALTTPAFTIYMVAYRQTKHELAPVFGHDALATYIFSGAAAELSSSFIWTPMEVVKGRTQLSEARMSTLSVVRSIYRAEGIKGFFRGYGVGVSIYVPHSVVWWIAYEKTKKALSKNRWLHTLFGPNAHLAQQGNENGKLSPLLVALSSATATTSATCTTNFLDVVKTRQQLATSNEIKNMRPDEAHGGVLTVARNLIKEVGLFRAAVKGLHIRLLNSIPSSILAMMIVETLKPDVNASVNVKISKKVYSEQLL